MSLLNIGISGLNVSQTSLQVTGNNIANADIASYSRQRVETNTLPEQLYGAGFLGAGAAVADISRIVDQFLVQQVRLDTSSFYNLNAYAENIGQIDALLADDLSGLGPVIDKFFSAVEVSAQDPTSEPARQVVLSQAEALVQRIQDLTARVELQGSILNSQISSMTEQASALAVSIAEINVAISYEIGRGAGSQPGQLLDQRDELLRQLSELVAVSTVESGNSLNVFIGNGQPLVIGGNASQLGVATSQDGSGQLEITFGTTAGSGQQVTRFITGGKLGGLLQSREGAVGEVLNELGRISLAMADSLNQQNKLGVDLDGNIGGNIFQDINAGSLPAQRIKPDSRNSDPNNQFMAVNINDVGALTSSNYQLNVIDNGGDGFVDYQLIRVSDNSTVVIDGTGPGVAQSLQVDGFSIDIPAATAANLALGDRFTIQPTRSGGSNIAVAITRVEQLAYAAPVVTAANSGNVGQGNISSGQALAIVDDGDIAFSPTNPLYSSPGVLAGEVLIRFTSATNYTVYENSNGTAPEALFSGAIIPGQKNSIFDSDSAGANYIGLQVEISGLPAAGDEFTLAFNGNGTSDNRNAVAIGALRTAKILNGGNTSFENAYGSLIEKIGSDTATSQFRRDAAESLLQQSQASRDSLSGVNLDEEAANLIKFEQAYNASAQIITIARQIFDTLMATFR